MKFRKLNLAASYILKPTLRGGHIRGVYDPAFEALRHFFTALEQAHLFLPVDEPEFTAAAGELLATHGLARPREFAAPLQYFVNSQLYYLARRVCAADWSVQREPQYAAETQHCADLRVTVVPDEHHEHDSFNIWLESDNARQDQPAKKLWEKLPLILSRAGGRSDVFVSFVYGATIERLRQVKATAAALERTILANVANRSINLSFAILYVTPPDPYADTLVDSRLTLYDGALMRVAEPYFHGQREDYWLHNEPLPADRGLASTH